MASLAQTVIQKEQELIRTVRELLEIEENADYLDNDMALIAHVWYIEFGEDITHKKPAWDLLDAIAKNTLTSAEKIIKTKRKLQEQFEHLRGEHYEIQQRTNQVNRKGQSSKKRVAGNNVKKRDSPGEG